MDLERESWVFGQDLEKEKVGFSAMGLERKREREREKAGFSTKTQRESTHLQPPSVSP